MEVGNPSSRDTPAVVAAILTALVWGALLATVGLNNLAAALDAPWGYATFVAFILLSLSTPVVSIALIALALPSKLRSKWPIALFGLVSLACSIALYRYLIEGLKTLNS